VRRRRVEREEEPRKKQETIEIPHRPLNEQVAIAAACADPQARAMLARLLPRPDFFLVPEHRPVWAATLEMERRRLSFDLMTLQQLGGDQVNGEYVAKLLALRPGVPDEANLKHHVAAIHWDRQRAMAVQGPVGALIEALRNPAEAPERVRALARHVSEVFGGAGSATHLRGAAELVEAMMGEVRRRVDGHACYPFGIRGLDYYEEGARSPNGKDIGGRHRLLPGAAPGQVTVVTAVSGAGKSVFTAHLALGFYRQGLKVLYGGWEPGSEMSVEMLACLDLGWNKTDVMEGMLAPEDLVELEERAHEIVKLVTFMDNPFGRLRGDKPSNERNLDLVQQHIEDSGCKVFFADLWDRCLVDDDPSDEKRALWRQHAIAEQTKTHNVLLVQQRLKDVEKREDKRPTREAIMGSSQWVQMADTILAVHRPALFKRIDDSKLEVIVWKQRYGRWPQVVEFDWDPEFGSVDGGRSLEFEHIGEQGGDFGDMAPARGAKKRGRR
jgi:DnaB-like helicase C terminal domain/DnaB-like helicase N terminal domain